MYKLDLTFSSDDVKRGVHPKLLKSLAYDDNFVEAVTALFRNWSGSGTLPKIWKSASVVSLFKKGIKKR